MKRIIYKPATDEQIPDGGIFYVLPMNGEVVDVLVNGDFTTAGTVLYDSAQSIELNEPFLHHFAGWEV